MRNPVHWVTRFHWTPLRAAVVAAVAVAAVTVPVIATSGGESAQRAVADVASFPQPASGEDVVATVESTADMAYDMVIYNSSCGYFRVGPIHSPTSVTLTNLGYAGNAYTGSDCSGKFVAAGIAGALLPMRWTWNAGALTHTMTFAGIGTNNARYNLATHLYIRGGSNGGGPNPVNLWAGFFSSTNPTKGFIELSDPFEPDKWIVYRVLGYQTHIRPQVQDFTVRMVDNQSVFEHGDEVFIQYTAAGDKGDAGDLAALEARVAALEAAP